MKKKNNNNHSDNNMKKKIAIPSKCKTVQKFENKLLIFILLKLIFAR